jgi:hypothetical protein
MIFNYVVQVELAQTFQRADARFNERLLDEMLRGIELFRRLIRIRIEQMNILKILEYLEEILEKMIENIDQNVKCH